MVDRNIDRQGKAGGQGHPGQSFDGIPAPGRPQAPNAECNFWDDDCAVVGYAGADGMAGTYGGVGEDGRDGPMTVIEVDRLDFNITVNVRGGDGGKGGKGGNGQHGGQGGQGGNGEECEFPRNGGNGGKGGDAGPGGGGGFGGRGGRISILYKQGVNAPTMILDNSGGSRGLPGESGAPGFPGAPGIPGSGGGEFSSSSDCENMGPVPTQGGFGAIPQPGPHGTPGANGPEPEVKAVP
jgi:hypothetical protein